VTRQLILLAGGTGTLGRELQPRLTAGGYNVRLITRHPERGRDLESDLCEVTKADVCEVSTLTSVLRGVRTVISAMSGYGPNSGADPRSVDGAGNGNLIHAAETAGAEHFLLVSVRGAGPHHPMELMRMKFQAEQELKASRLAWTIVRPSLFMETWASVVGEPLMKQGKALVFGRGRNPINLVSACDVADVIMRAVTEPAMRGVEVDVAGPDDITLLQCAATIASAAAVPNRYTRIPRPALRLMSVLARPISPTFARLAHDAVVMDTLDFTRYNNAMMGATSLTDVASKRRAAGPMTRRP